MVKKLYKHEFLAWLRVLPVIFGILLAVAGLHRIIQCFENDTVSYRIISGSASFMYAVMLMVCIASPVVFGIQRFHKNLFTGEGYLTLTLPVTPGNHLWVKSLTALAFSLISLVVCLLSVVIITAGEVLTEICKAGVYLYQRIPQQIVKHLPGYMAEGVFLVLVSFFASYLLFYTCICIGQLFRKNRVLAAVGVYFAYYVINQMVGTAMGVGMVLLEEAGKMERIYRFIADNPYRTIHIGLCGGIVLDGLLALAFFLICHHILKKKLNLE